MHYKKLQHIFLALFFYWLLTTKVSAEVNTLTQIFQSKANHYFFRYPANWHCDDHHQGVVVCKSEVPDVSINLQTIWTKKGGGKYVDVKALMNDFMTQVPMHTTHAQFSNRRTLVIQEPNGAQYAGEEIILTFKENGKIFQQQQIMLQDPHGLVFQNFAFRAPVSLYAAHATIAKAIFASWEISP